jgi:hypothetical protein
VVSWPIFFVEEAVSYTSLGTVSESSPKVDGAGSFSDSSRRGVEMIHATYGTFLPVQEVN